MLENFHDQVVLNDWHKKINRFFLDTFFLLKGSNVFLYVGSPKGHIFFSKTKSALTKTR